MSRHSIIANPHQLLEIQVQKPTILLQVSGERDVSLDNIVTSPDPETETEEPGEVQEKERGGYGFRAQAKRRTGNPVLARMLAASCRSKGKGICRPSLQSR